MSKEVTAKTNPGKKPAAKSSLLPKASKKLPQSSEKSTSNNRTIQTTAIPKKLSKNKSKPIELVKTLPKLSMKPAMTPTAELVVNEPVLTEPQVINMKQAVSWIFHRTNPVLNEATKWPVFLDSEDIFSSFCRVRDTMYINTLNEEELTPEIIRMKVITAYYQGFPLIIDFGYEPTHHEKLAKICNEVNNGLFEDICEKRLVTDSDRYKTLIREEDGNRFIPETIGEYQKFFVVFLSTNLSLENYFSKFAVPFIIRND